eukprot:scaffold11849_cov130-Isochrysis_galbana.AAC.1
MGASTYVAPSRSRAASAGSSGAVGMSSAGGATGSASVQGGRALILLGVGLDGPGSMLSRCIGSGGTSVASPTGWADTGCNDTLLA